MRLFIAVPIPEYVAVELHKAQAILKQFSVHQSFPSEFHVTLAFFGDVSEVRAEQVKKQLKSVHFSGFTAQLSSVGCFPNASNPRVVWIGLEPQASWQALHEKIMHALEKVSEEKFVAHVTLSRVKTNTVEIAAMLSKLVIPSLFFDVSEVLLMQSVITGRSAQHTVLDRFVVEKRKPVAGLFGALHLTDDEKKQARKRMQEFHDSFEADISKKIMGIRKRVS